jgi:AraC-like DNA-binding protein
MWLVRTVTSADPDEFVASVRSPSLKVFVSERGQFDAATTLIDFARIRALRSSERLARIMHIAPKRSGIVFQTKPGADMFWNGALMGHDQVALNIIGEENILRSAGPSHYAAVTLDAADMEAMSEPAAGVGCAPATRRSIISPGPEVMARLRSMHAAAACPAHSLEPFANLVGRAQAIEWALIETLQSVVALPNRGQDTIARQHHQLVVRRFLEALNSAFVVPPQMDAVSKAIGVSSRTLRLACQEQLGVSPTQYLLLRRMRMAYRALQQADPIASTVTDIATILGFWELGRFAVRYREIFGESPSSTLKSRCGSSRSLMLVD